MMPAALNVQWHHYVSKVRSRQSNAARKAVIDAPTSWRAHFAHVAIQTRIFERMNAE